MLDSIRKEKMFENNSLCLWINPIIFMNKWMRNGKRHAEESIQMVY